MHGVGIQKDFKLAVQWLHRAAEQENIKAQLDLGVLIIMDSVFVKMISRPYIGIVKQRSKEVLRPNII